MGPATMIFVFWMLSFKPTFSLSSFTFIKRLFSSSSLSAIRVVSSAYLRLLIFLPAILIPACASSSPEFLMMYPAYKLQYFGHLTRRVDSLEKTDAGRDWGQEEKGTTEDEMAGWHYGLDGHESEWTPGDGDEHGGLACCDSWGLKELDMTERLNWTELSHICSDFGAQENKVSHCFPIYSPWSDGTGCTKFLFISPHPMPSL